MSLDLKRQLVAQLVQSSRLLRNYIDASGRQLVDDLDGLRDSIASDALRDIPSNAIETSLKTLRDIKERIKGLAEPPGGIAAK